MSATRLSSGWAVDIPERTATLHFGLSWAPLIGSRTARLARRRAASAHASHYIYCGERGVAVALLHLTGPNRHRRHFSAASIFAQCHPVGAVVWAAPLPGGRYWLVGARDGAVLTRTDRLYDSASELQAAVEQLIEDYPGLSVLRPSEGLSGEGSGPAGAGLGDRGEVPTGGTPAAGDPVAGDPVVGNPVAGTPVAGEPVNGTLVAGTLAAGDRVASPPGDVLQTLTNLLDHMPAMLTLSWYRRVRLGGWLGGLSIAACVALFGQRGLSEGEQVEGPAPELDDTPLIELQAARAHAVQARAQSQWSSAASFVAVLSSLRVLPVMLDGWRIAGARCDWAKTAWSCTADYRRDRAAATNAALFQKVPADRQIRFTPFSLAHVSWAVTGMPAPLIVDNFPEPAWVDTMLVSALQSYAPAFSHMTLGQRTDLSLEVMPVASQRLEAMPIASQRSEAVAMDRLPGRRSLMLQGPFRSFGILADLEGHAGWQEVVLTIRQGISPALARSALQIALKGWIYEK